MKNKRASVFHNQQNDHPLEPAGIKSLDVFRVLLRHERSRSDRDDSEFSLVVLACLSPVSPMVDPFSRSQTDP